MFLLAGLVCPFIIHRQMRVSLLREDVGMRSGFIFIFFQAFVMFHFIPFFPQVGATRRLGTMTAQKATCPGTETTNGLVRETSLFSARRDSSVHSTPVTFHSRTRPVEIEAHRY